MGQISIPRPLTKVATTHALMTPTARLLAAPMDARLPAGDRCWHWASFAGAGLAAALRFGRRACYSDPVSSKIHSDQTSTQLTLAPEVEATTPAIHQLTFSGLPTFHHLIAVLPHTRHTHHNHRNRRQHTPADAGPPRNPPRGPPRWTTSVHSPCPGLGPKMAMVAYQPLTAYTRPFCSGWYFKPFRRRPSNRSHRFWSLTFGCEYVLCRIGTWVPLLPLWTFAIDLTSRACTGACLPKCEFGVPFSSYCFLPASLSAIFVFFAFLSWWPSVASRSTWHSTFPPPISTLCKSQTFFDERWFKLYNLIIIIWY